MAQNSPKKGLLMKKFAFALLVSLCLSGCFVNERGIGNRFYSDCKAYYNASGNYHEQCPTNWINVPLTPDTLYKKRVATKR